MFISMTTFLAHSASRLLISSRTLWAIPEMYYHKDSEQDKAYSGYSYGVSKS